ncbi:MAG: hypothetical protein KGD63_11305 [Candidatus Lokiarchaeota archaeon]|nr:hypothetical protein [Candidatus Lokiarchaeota archaeon]
MKKSKNYKSLLLLVLLILNIFFIFNGFFLKQASAINRSIGVDKDEVELGESITITLGVNNRGQYDDYAKLYKVINGATVYKGKYGESSVSHIITDTLTQVGEAYYYAEFWYYVSGMGGGDYNTLQKIYSEDININNRLIINPEDKIKEGDSIDITWGIEDYSDVYLEYSEVSYSKNNGIEILYSTFTGIGTKNLQLKFNSPGFYRINVKNFGSIGQGGILQKWEQSRTIDVLNTFHEDIFNSGDNSEIFGEDFSDLGILNNPNNWNYESGDFVGSAKDSGKNIYISSSGNINDDCLLMIPSELEDAIVHQILPSYLLEFTKGEYLTFSFFAKSSHTETFFRAEIWIKESSSQNIQWRSLESIELNKQEANANAWITVSTTSFIPYSAEKILVKIICLNNPNLNNEEGFVDCAKIYLSHVMENLEYGSLSLRELAEINSCTRLIESKYDFDGLDLNFESSISINVDAPDYYPPETYPELPNCITQLDLYIKPLHPHNYEDMQLSLKDTFNTAYGKPRINDPVKEWQFTTFKYVTEKMMGVAVDLITESLDFGNTAKFFTGIILDFTAKPLNEEIIRYSIYGDEIKYLPVTDTNNPEIHKQWQFIDKDTPFTLEDGYPNKNLTKTAIFTSNFNAILKNLEKSFLGFEIIYEVEYGAGIKKDGDLGYQINYGMYPNQIIKDTWILGKKIDTKYDAFKPETTLKYPIFNYEDNYIEFLSDSNKIKIDWINALAQTHGNFRIYRENYPGFLPDDNNLIAEIFDGGSEYLDSDINPNTPYSYIITQVSEDGIESLPSAYASMTTGDFSIPEPLIHPRAFIENNRQWVADIMYRDTPGHESVYTEGQQKVHFTYPSDSGGIFGAAEDQGTFVEMAGFWTNLNLDSSKSLNIQFNFRMSHTASFTPYMYIVIMDSDGSFIACPFFYYTTANYGWQHVNWNTPILVANTEYKMFLCYMDGCIANWHANLEFKNVQINI